MDNSEHPDLDELLDRALSFAIQNEDADGDDEAPASRSSDQRFEIRAVLGQGGMGSIFRAWDRRLHREVALKTLHEHLRLSNRMLARFRTESRVLAQLQHPGIVPIYDCGVRADGRPYFAMKLVQGRTLKEVLLAADLKQDTARLLGVVARVAHSLAYAHSKGVIHRDLKPSNVMIADYGEILVMDWGLAKLVEGPARESDTEDISVAAQAGRSGTPLYMSPEQADGSLAPLTAATDLFSVGSIIYEVLIGVPPFGGLAVEEAPGRCRQGELADAVARLDASGAEPDLIEIAKGCLQVNPAARPSADEVAQQVESWLERVERRAGAARILAIEERARRDLEAGRAREAQEIAALERRARKITLGLSAVVIVVATLAILVWARAESAEADKRREAKHALHQAIFSAELRLEHARRAGFEDRVAWEVARSSMSQVEEAARHHPPAEGDQAALLRLRQSVEAEARRAERDRKLLRMLDRNTPHAPHESARALYRHLSQVFQVFPVDPRTMGPSTIAAILLDSAVAPELLVALDDWIFAHPLREAAARNKLIDAANLLDADEWRRALRDQLKSRDPGEVLRIKAAADLAELPLSSQRLLARSLHHLGSIEEAVEVLRVTRSVFPEDYDAAHELGVYLRSQAVSRAEWREIVELMTIALAARPNNAHSHLDLGRSLLDSGEPGQAKRALLRARQRFPKDSSLATCLSRVEEALGNQEAAIRALEDALSLHADCAHCWTRLAELYQKHGQRAGAISAYREALSRKPDLPRALASLTSLLFLDGEIASSLEVAKTAQSMHPSKPWALCNLGIAFIAVNDLEAAKPYLSSAVQHDPGHRKAWCTLGHVLLELGDFASAVDAYQRGIGEEGPVALVAARERWFAKAQRAQELDSLLDEAMQGDDWPETVRARAELGWVAAIRGQERLAAKLLCTALQQAPELSKVFDPDLTRAALVLTLKGGSGTSPSQGRLPLGPAELMRIQVARWEHRVRADPLGTHAPEIASFLAHPVVDRLRRVPADEAWPLEGLGRQEFDARIKALEDLIPSTRQPREVVH